MKKIPIVVGVSIFVVIIAISILIYLKSDSITGNIVRETPSIKIGALIPLTGLRADGGEYCRRGLEMASTELDNKYKIIYEDSQYDAKIAVGGIQKLIAVDSIKYVIGPYASPEALAVAPIAEENRIILITPTAQAKSITQAGDYIFRTQISVDQEAPFWADFLEKYLRTGALSVIAINNDYGISYFETFKESYDKKINSVQYYDPKETDFKTYLLKIKSDDSRDVLILATPKNTGTIIKQSKELGMKVNFYTSSPAEAKELIALSENNADGLLFPSPFDDTSDVKSMKEYREKYFSLYSSTPEMISANCYDSLKILAYCSESVGNNVESVKSCIYSIKNFPGASGILSFDNNGDVHKDLVVKTVRNNMFVKYDG